MDRNIWLDGIMGLVVADALGVPVEFRSRESLKDDPVVDMREYGTYNLSKGSWSDDSSMTLATLASLKNGYNPEDIMRKFILWMTEGAYTPDGECFDIGNTTSRALHKYMEEEDITSCGGIRMYDNGNGSLMRILPACLFYYDQQKIQKLSDEEVIHHIHEISALTHAHYISMISCGLYFFMVRSVLDENGSLMERLQKGLDIGLAFYNKTEDTDWEPDEFFHFWDLKAFREFEEDRISSGGYVIDSLEAAIWCLINTNSYKDAMLKAVNLGEDTDTVAAIAGGLAGLYYGYEGIPKEWLEVIRKREGIEELCRME